MWLPRTPTFSKEYSNKLFVSQQLLATPLSPCPRIPVRPSDAPRSEFNPCEADTVWAMMLDWGEGSDILDAIVAEDRCGTCGRP
jgi:hypothetical protein